ncbi:MAG: flippase-like domain-containing protein, partial [Candidatus Aminicenantes bacterium]|nr:flippase-like domain-containing protein [Candidatus Aminicenantes bacterium]
MNNHRHHPVEQAEKNNKFYQTFQTLFFFLGLVLLAYLIYRMGLATILENISRVGVWFILICFLGGLWLFLQATAWWKISKRDFRRVPLWFLFKVKIISDAINTVLPSANLGGETARAYLTRRYLSLKESLAGIIVDKTYELAGGILFMILGFTLASAYSIFPKSLVLPAILCLVIVSIGIFLFIGFQLRGIYKILLRSVGFIPLIRRFLHSKETQIQN